MRSDGGIPIGHGPDWGLGYGGGAAIAMDDVVKATA